MSDAESEETDWGRLLAEARREEFVGRRAELEAFQSFFASETTRLLEVTGPAGIGKSALLAEARDAAQRAELETAWIDADYIRSTRPRLEGVFRDASSGGTRTILFVDEFHALEEHFSWLRRELFPSLPESVLLATASRQPLPADWRTAPGWSQITETIELEALGEAASLEYLERRGVPENRRADVLEFSAGHPLTLAVASGAVLDDPEIELGPEAGLAELQPLLRELLGNASTDEQLDTLALAVLVRRLREDLLAHALGSDGAGEQMRWLGRQPFIRADQHGLFPHAVIRRLMLDDLVRYEWRRVERLAERGQDFYASHAFGGDRSRSQTMFYDSHYLGRVHGLNEGWDIVEEKRETARALEEMVPSCLEAVEAFENDEAGALFEYWWERQPGGLRVLTGPDGAVEGFTFFIDVDPEATETRDRDPVVETFCGYLEEHPLEKGEHALLCRFWGGVDSHQESAPIRADLFAEMSARLALPPTTIGCAAHFDAEYWRSRDDNVLDEFGDTAIGSCTYVLLGHDWRERSREAWFRRRIQALTGRLEGPKNEDVAQGPRPSEIEAAARNALKNFHRGDALADNPLIDSELVRERCERPNRPEAREAALRALLEEACASLGTGGEDAMHIEILERTYLDPEQNKQLTVASEMDMAYSTYRKHLRKATDRVAERLRHWLR